MDSLTQIALGAAVGEALLGKRVGYKAALWGAIGGTIPDLDVLVEPLVSDWEFLAIHRGISHSIFFAVLLAPFLGWGVERIYRHSARNKASRKEWGWLFFGALLTHSLLDCFTTYGTQLFQPFSDYPVILGSIFIIDPLYTVPLLVGLLSALLLKRGQSWRCIANYSGIALSTLYLLSTFGVKLTVETAFREALAVQQIPVQRLFTSPTALNSILWLGIAEHQDELWIGLYSILDKDRDIQFRHIKKHSEIIQKNLDQPAIQRLLWFSRGFYTITRDNGKLYFNDLRFGRSDIWLGSQGDYIFMFELLKAPGASEDIIDVIHHRPAVNISRQLLVRLLGRIWGFKQISD